MIHTRGKKRKTTGENDGRRRNANKDNDACKTIAGLENHERKKKKRKGFKLSVTAVSKTVFT